MVFSATRFVLSSPVETARVFRVGPSPISDDGADGGSASKSSRGPHPEPGLDINRREQLAPTWWSAVDLEEGSVASEL